MPKSIKFFKDKLKARIYRNRQRKNNYKRGGHVRYDGKGENYTENDDYFILGTKLTDREIANTIERSVPSIQTRRWRVLSGRAKSAYNV